MRGVRRLQAAILIGLLLAGFAAAPAASFHAAGIDPPHAPTGMQPCPHQELRPIGGLEHPAIPDITTRIHSASACPAPCCGLCAAWAAAVIAFGIDATAVPHEERPGAGIRFLFPEQDVPPPRPEG